MLICGKLALINYFLINFQDKYKFKINTDGIMNKQQLATKIWESANKMRSKIEPNEYKDYILGFIFYKYLSDKEVKHILNLGFTKDELITINEDNEDIMKCISDELGYFISYKDLFSTWIEKGNSFNVADVRDALSAFNRLINSNFSKVYRGIFETLQTGLGKLGENSAAQSKSIINLINLIKDIPMDGKQDYDVLGFIYEYLISQFAANAGKKAGEFYTPHEVSMLMSEIVADHLKDRELIKIYDPTSGSGSLLINIGKSISKHVTKDNHIIYYAQELKQNTYNLTRMNLIMRGILPNHINTRNGDTLEDDWPYFDENNPIETYDPLRVDAVVSNPPYSQNWDPDNKENDPRYSAFGLAPKSKADFAFLLHDLFHLKTDGIMSIVLPHGVLFRGGEEGKIRKNLIENNHIDAIIGLPANLFFGTGIPTVVLIIKRKRVNTDILIIDASKDFTKDGKNNKLRSSDIKKIVDTVTQRIEVDNYSKTVSREEIRENDYNLNIPRYVDSSEDNETWDLYASMFGGIPENELNTLNAYWTVFPELKETLFSKENGPYYNLKIKDINNEIVNFHSVKRFINDFNKSFLDFKDFLKKELLQNLDKINIAEEQDIISNDIFNRLTPFSLIDKYEAYQIFDDQWSKTVIDLEILKTEGFNALKQVDPKMITKKIKGKDTEIQDGWIGHLLPFELVQNYLLKDKIDSLKSKELRLDEIKSTFDEILSSLDEEDLDKEFINEDKTSFINSVVIKEAKKINSDIKKNVQYEEESIELKLIEVDKLINEEKQLKAEVKKESIALERVTKESIENLCDEQLYALLELKWIDTLYKEMEVLPMEVINKLSNSVKSLSEKYLTTYKDIEDEINETENSLSSMLDELVGSEYDLKAITALKELLKDE